MGIVRRDRTKAGKLKPRNKCRKWELQVGGGGPGMTRRFEGTWTQAEAAYADFEREVGLRPPDTETAFGAYADVWLSRREREMSPRTVQLNRHMLKAARMHLEDRPIGSLTANDVAGLYDALRRGETLSGRPWAEKSLAAMHSTMHALMSAAVADGCGADIMGDVPAPRPSRPDKRALPDGGIEKLARSLDWREPHQRAVMLICAFGLRTSEAVALEGRDWCDGAMRVDRADDGAGGLKAPKSAAGRRAVPAPWWMAELLDAEAVPDGDRIVLRLDGTPMPPQAVGSWWRAHKRSFGCELTPHELRHSWITQAARSGVHPRVAQEMAGHASLDVTMETYTHVAAEDRRKAVASMFSTRPDGPKKGRMTVISRQNAQDTPSELGLSEDAF